MTPTVSAAPSITRYSLTRLAGDQRGELHHQPGPGVEAALAQHLVEGEVVEVLDQLGVGLREGRDVAREQLVVVALGLFRRGQGRLHRVEEVSVARDEPQRRRAVLVVGDAVTMLL